MEIVKDSPRIEEKDLVSHVTTPQEYTYSSSSSQIRNGSSESVSPSKKYRLAVLDFGIKKSILDLLSENGFDIRVFPATTKLEQLNTYNFDALFLSNGPGNPAILSELIENAQDMLNCGKPIFAICLGHQILSLASSLVSYKLKFGHRGANQPVYNYKTGQVEITAQNHGFAIENWKDDSNSSVVMQHVNLNDQSVESFIDEKRNILAVQYHPEGSPGPHDSRHLFTQFYGMVNHFYQKKV